MLISYNWTKEYFKKLPKPDKLADLLNRRAFEIEGLEEKRLSDGTTDWVIDADVLPNRAHDALCHLGMAREIATITGHALIVPEIISKETNIAGEGEFKVSVNCRAVDAYDKEVDVCRRSMHREIRNIRVTESPQEIKNKLEALGQKSINNVVDITNIVMYELGQPMHAFDANKISGTTIYIRNAKKGERLVTLDNKDVTLSESDAIIADDKGPLDIAGIKGGKRPELDGNTTDILLEAANFHPTIIRRTSKKIGISTDASKRFENEITPALTEKAINYATNLILKYASTPETQIYETVDHYPRPVRNYRTGTSVREVNRILGLDLSENKIKKILKELNFEYDIVNPRDKIIVEARNNLGKPFRLGASVSFDAPNIFDCSSFVAYVYSLAGYSIPRISIDQFVASEEITREQALPGDLIFSNSENGKSHQESVEYLPGTKVEGGIDHVGILIGGNEAIHCGRGNSGVEVVNIDEHADFSKNVRFARYIDANLADNKTDSSPEKNRFAVKVPIERLDVKTERELIEEIGRVYGYEKIKDQQIGDIGFTPDTNDFYALINTIREILIGEGFSEIITYSFSESGDIAPEKPIADDKGFLRTNLKEGMEKALEKNVRNADWLGVDHIKTFEIGTVFVAESAGEEKGAITERNVLSIGVNNKIGIKKPRPSDIIKDAIKKISEKIPAIASDINVSDKDSVVEIDLTNLNTETLNLSYPDFPEEQSTKYKTVSPYPFMLRDIAVWMPSDVSPKKLLQIIESESGDLLIRTTLFDVYEKDDRTSYAYRLVFQSDDRTLTDGEINAVMDGINKRLSDKNWEVR